MVEMGGGERVEIGKEEGIGEKKREWGKKKGTGKKAPRYWSTSSLQCCSHLIVALLP